MFGFGKKSKTKGKIAYSPEVRDFVVFCRRFTDEINELNDRRKELNGRFVASHLQTFTPAGVKWEPINEGAMMYFFPSDVPDDIANNHLHPDFMRKAKIGDALIDYYKEARDNGFSDEVYDKLTNRLYNSFLVTARHYRHPYAAENLIYKKYEGSSLKNDLDFICEDVMGEEGLGK